MISLFLLLFCSVLHAYCDPELETLWGNISDLTSPTYQEYQQIENYLRNGKRPYLALLRIPHKNSDRLRSILNFKLVGDNGEMPVFEKHVVNLPSLNNRRCILLFGSYNGGYPQKVRRALNDLKQCGYCGDVLIRIGGFPNLQNGGIQLCHVPYAFKVAFMKEAALLGYKEILWLDSAMHPLSNLNFVFNEIQERGYFFTYVGSLQDNAPSNLIEAGHALNISESLFPFIDHIASGLIGANMDNEPAREFLNDWYQETSNVFPNITWFPEEMSLSVTAWRADLEPVFWFGEIVCGEHELSILSTRPSLQFYIDTSR